MYRIKPFDNKISKGYVIMRGHIVESFFIGKDLKEEKKKAQRHLKALNTGETQRVQHYAF